MSKSIEKLLSSKVKNSKLYLDSLTHRSASNQNNELLEFFGDAILGFIIAEFLYNEFPNDDEGSLSRKRSYLVRKETLSKIALDYNLGSNIILGVGEKKSGGSRRDSIISDALEALIAVVYIEDGYEGSRKFIYKIFENYLKTLPKDDDLNKWRNNFQGISYYDEKLDLKFYGAVDDVWQNTQNGKLVVADYKSQANTKELEPVSYLSDPYKEGYKVQMDFYAYLLQQMGFEVEDTAYFLVCNADREADSFNGEMKFREVLIPYRWNSDWVPGSVTEMIYLLNDNNAPDANPSCKNCAYVRQRASLERR